MGPIHVPFRTGFAKIRKNSISKTLVGVEIQEKGIDFEMIRIRVGFNRNFSVPSMP